MKNFLLKRTDKVKGDARTQLQCGFSVMEMLVSICILLPIMAGALQLFSVGVNHHASEKSSIEANQNASAGLNMMLMEIAQAGSHGDTDTSIQATVTGNAIPQTISVASAEKFNIGDFIEVVDVSSGDVQTVELTGVGYDNNTLTGIFLGNYDAGDQIRLFAMPYTQGILPPAGLSADSSMDVTTLQFFGDIYGDGNMYYVEYDIANGEITRSMTNFTETQKGPAVTLIDNVSAAQFTLHTDERNVITSVTVSFTVENKWETAGQLEQISFSSKVAIPSTEAASTLYYENLYYGGFNRLPPNPSRLALWTIQYGEY